MASAKDNLDKILVYCIKHLYFNKTPVRVYKTPVTIIDEAIGYEVPHVTVLYCLV